MSYEISVIIPVFNVEKYIRETLESIVNQTIGIEKIEVIIVNDCTPDNSMAIVEEFANQYSSFKIINHKENKGLGESRNTGLKHVSSDYVTFLDSDDFIKKNTFENSLEKIKNSGADLLIYNWDFFTEGYEPPSIHQPNFKQDEIIYDFKDKPELVFYSSAWNKIYHKSLFNYLKFPIGFYEDNKVSCEILVNASKIFLNSEGCYYYRKNSQSITQTITIKNPFDLIKSIEELTNLIKKYPDYKKIINRLVIKFVHDILVWIYYYDWFIDEEIAIISKLQDVMGDISKDELKQYKALIYSHFPYYEEDVLNLRNYSSEEFLAIYKYFKSNPKVSTIANLYVDIGFGFNEQYKIPITYTPKKINKLTFNLNDFNNINSIRFDPVEGVFSKVKILNNLPIISSNCDNSINDEYQLFLTTDPHYVLSNEVESILEIEFEIIFLENDELTSLFSDKNALINDLKNQQKSKKGLFNFRSH